MIFLAIVMSNLDVFLCSHAVGKTMSEYEVIPLGSVPKENHSSVLCDVHVSHGARKIFMRALYHIRVSEKRERSGDREDMKIEDKFLN